MAKSSLTNKIGRLFRQSKWQEARTLLESERRTRPEDHWVLTQLAVTFYEQRRYAKALRLEMASLKVVPDCPLTLWNLAGTLDAMGRHVEAIAIYTSLLRSRKTPQEDPCWESLRWADALKADCIYRLGVCYQNLRRKEAAERCFRRYLDLLLTGIDGSYSPDDVLRQVRGLHDRNAGRDAAENELRKAVNGAVRLVKA
jgi:tetratricopeptide (TPR) repeat protein